MISITDRYQPRARLSILPTEAALLQILAQEPIAPPSIAAAARAGRDAWLAKRPTSTARRVAVRQRRETRLLVGAERGRCAGRPAAGEQHGGETGAKRQRRAQPQEPGLQLERRPEEDEIAVARDEIGAYRVVAFALLDAASNEDTDVARERRVGIVDRLVLADQAAQLGREHAGARFQRRVLHHFVRLHGEGRRRRKREGCKSEAKRAHDHCAGWAREPPLAFARAATPRRRRRSASDKAPPSAMAAPPSQISVTSGFQ